MCAGLIGYRSYNMIGEKPLTIGIYGFGAAAHIMVQVALFEGKRAFVFTREGDVAAQRLALKLGAEWAGDSAMEPPEKLDAAIIFAPVGNLVPKALRDINNGGIVVCGGIHMSDIPSFPYNILWGEKTIKSVANLTRYDGMKFLELAPKVPIKTVVTEFKLENANLAIEKLRNGAITGAAVLTM